jgi:hypothetical protein
MAGIIGAKDITQLMKGVKHEEQGGNCEYWREPEPQIPILGFFYFMWAKFHRFFHFV